MSEIRLLKDDEFKGFVELVCNAYPGTRANNPEDKQKLEEAYIKIQKEVPAVQAYGCFRDGQLLGGMRLHDFMVNFNGCEIKAGGLAYVAVDLMHKKEKAAKEIVSYFINHYREAGARIAMLYPFRPDFYKNMGFGLGTKTSVYCVRPSDLPRGSSKAHLEFLSAADRPALMDFYHRTYKRVHGMIRREDFEVGNLMAYVDNKMAVYKKDGIIQGCMIFTFKKPIEGNFLINDIYVREMLYENTEVLMEFLTFLNSQQDQVRYITLNMHDDYLNYIFKDPRNCSDNLYAPVFHESNKQALGVMYRILDIEGIFNDLKAYSFGKGNCRLKLTVEDDLLPQNGGSRVIHFKDGFPQLMPGGEWDVELKMNIADFSSMFMGTVSLGKLHSYGLAAISDTDKVNLLDGLFRCGEKPVCVTAF